MKINPQALVHVRDAEFSGSSFVQILEQLLNMALLGGSPDTEVTLDWQNADVDPAPGDLIPFITIGLRPAKNLDPAKVDHYLERLQDETPAD